MRNSRDHKPTRLAVYIAVGVLLLAAPLSTAQIAIAEQAVSAAATPDGDELSRLSDIDSQGLDPIIAEDQEATRASGIEPSCTEEGANGDSYCVTQGSPDGPQATDGASARTIQPLPTWCRELPTGIREVTRTQSCQQWTVTIQKRLNQNGTSVVVGTATVGMYSYQYMTYSTPVIAHQFGFKPASVVGDVAGVTISAYSNCAGGCVETGPGVIGNTPLSVGTWVENESFTGPNTTAIGSIVSVGTAWVYTINFPSQSPYTAATSMAQARCDNASGGSAPTPGCVIPIGPGKVIYAQATNPELVNHINWAHASGLPGSSVNNPIHRTTLSSRINANRAASCGSAPSIAGKQCDEYPFASTFEGAASGGPVRSFSGCSFPEGFITSTTGYSHCMINSSQNLSGGAILGNTYRQQRILDADPFSVGFNFTG